MKLAIPRQLIRTGLIAATACVLVASLGAIPFAQEPAPSKEAVADGPFDQLTYRYIGPVGNRVSAVAGVPGDANTYFIGAASGGIFRTTDAGATWEPVFDDQPVASVGALAIDSVNTNVIWAGTGETFIRSNVLTGNGIYKSVDGGDSWQHMGLDKTGRIGRIVVDPLHPEVVFAAAMGHAYGPQQERGVFRTKDAGKTWERVLFVDEHTGAADVVMDPNNPNIMFAGTWPLLIRTWGRTSGGPGGGLWMSKDGGDTWKNLTGTRGLPSGPIGKIGLGMTKADSKRVYALIETSSNGLIAPVDPGHGTLYRSDDGGASWNAVSSDHDLMQRPLYYTRLAVSPDDPDELHTMATRHRRSLDGGRTWTSGNAGGDNHDMWIDPLLPNRMAVGNDGGVSISTNRGKSWLRPQMPIAQMYHVAVDNKVPYFVMGNRQDGASRRGPSNSLTGGSIPIGEWRSVGGCESGFSVPTSDGNTIWSGCYDGILDVHDVTTGVSRNVSPWPDNPEGWAAGDVRFRFQWTFPIHISPHNDNKVFVGSQVVHRTTDGGVSWRVISPDLSTGDPQLLQKTGGLTFDDTSPTYGAVLFAIAESPLEEDVIWAGTNDGLVHVTRNGGTDWTNVSGNIPDLPKFSTISNIEPSPHAAGTAYVAVDAHQIGIFEPFLYKTADYGRTWTRLDGHTGSPASGSGWQTEAVADGAIPHGPLSYTHVIREDPKRRGLLYVGTAAGLFVSVDDGGAWQSLQSNLPHVPVHWLTIQPHFNDLVVATYGRGFWIMDDITPLQQITDAVRASDVHVFTPRDAYRFLSVEGAASGNDPAAGRNPSAGASVSYWLSDAVADASNQTDAADTPEVAAAADPGIPGNSGARADEMESAKKPRRTQVTIEILDAAGEVVRSLKNQPAKAGINRATWNLRYESSERAVMRTKPLGHPHVDLNDSGTRTPGDGGTVSPLAPPGHYTFRIKVGDRETQEQPLVVLKDPKSAGSDADIAAQFAMQLELRANQNDVAAVISEAERVRAQLGDLRGLLSGRDDSAEINKQITAIDEKIIDLEMELTDLRLVGGQDTLRYPRQLYAKISSLAGYISGHDFAPTEAHRAVHEMYKESLGTHQQQMNVIRDTDLADFNKMLRDKGIGTVISGKPSGK
ncbi:MAG: sialidase [Acidobacteria bacterium]|nr:sialidase [Acidobacteriota bacterium]